MWLFEKYAGSGDRPLPAKSMKKIRALIFLIFAAFSIASCFVKGINVSTAVNFARLFLLACATESDLRKHKVNNIYPVILLLTGFFGITSFSTFLWQLIPALLVFGFLVAIYYIFPKKTMGGADIKILSALAFVFGIEGLLHILVSTVIILLLVVAVLFITKNKKYLKEKAALVPFISIGTAIYILL